MATRRMISKAIIDSARFMKMPSTSQNLYFHLIVRADDDGVVEAYNILRTIGASEDDLRILVAKQYVVVLNEDLVTFVSDWLEHNKLRSDRKINSIYQELLVQVVPEAKTIIPRIRTDRRGASHGQPKDGIGKVRLGQYSVPPNSQESTTFATPLTMKDEQEEKCIIWFREHGITSREEELIGFYQKHGYSGIMKIHNDWLSDKKAQQIGIGAFVKRLRTLVVKKGNSKVHSTSTESQREENEQRVARYKEYKVEFEQLSESRIQQIKRNIKSSHNPSQTPLLFYQELRDHGNSQSDIFTVI